MTREDALEESIKVYALVKSWRRATPWARAVGKRWAELHAYGLGNTDKEPDPAWTPLSIAHLEGAPERSGS